MNTGVAPNHATTSAVAANVKLGQNTASPALISRARKMSASASVPFEQDTTSLAPQNAGEVCLQHPDFRPENILPMRENAGDRFVDHATEAVALRGEVDEGN